MIRLRWGFFIIIIIGRKVTESMLYSCFWFLSDDTILSCSIIYDVTFDNLMMVELARFLHYKVPPFLFVISKYTGEDTLRLSRFQYLPNFHPVVFGILWSLTNGDFLINGSPLYVLVS